MLHDVENVPPPRRTALEAFAGVDRERKVLVWGPETDLRIRSCCRRFTILHRLPDLIHGFKSVWKEGKRRMCTADDGDEDPGWRTNQSRHEGYSVDVPAALRVRESFELRWCDGRRLGKYRTLEEAQRMAELALQVEENNPGVLQQRETYR